MGSFALPRRETLGANLTAGLTVALVSIPGGMAYALVAGVEPIYGLYTGMVTTIVASIMLSTSLMVVTLTNALALVTADTLGALSPNIDQATALFTLTFAVGAFMFLLGALRLGSIIRFVADEVMIGFIFVTALLIVLGQYDELVGFSAELEANKLTRAIDITLNLDQWDVSTALVGFGSIVVLLLLKRSPLEQFADVLIIILGAAAALLLSLQSVEIVGDFAEVPRTFPTPVLPDLTLLPALAAGAVAAGIVGLAESSGVGSAYPNPSGRRSDMSRDFSAQGLGNLTGSFFQAMPAGGSLSRSGVNVSGGADSRWAGIFAGLLMILFVLLFGPLAELIPMTVLAALLIVIGFEVMRKEWPGMVESWRISKLRSVAMIAVIVVGIFEDLTVAIFIGVGLSLAIFVYEAATSAHSYELILTEAGQLEERPVREKLDSNEVAIIQLRGNIYFASVYSFEEFVPDMSETSNAVIILRERDRDKVNLTAFEWLIEHSEKFRKQGNRLMLSGLDQETIQLYRDLGAMEVVGEETLFIRKPELGASTREAYQAALAWIEKNMSRAQAGEGEQSGPGTGSRPSNPPK